MADATETVQELYAAFSRGDLAAILAKLSDDVVWESEGPAVISSSGIRHGKAEAQGFFEGLNNDFTDHQLTIRASERIYLCLKRAALRQTRRPDLPK